MTAPRAVARSARGQRAAQDQPAAQGQRAAQDQPAARSGDAADAAPSAGAADILGPAGALHTYLPHYEHRPGQLAMAAAVAAALSDQRTLLVEAGTGTGKTLAYLVPALLSGLRVVVSTGTRTLQDQIARHDVPLLQAVLPRPFSAVTLKGVSNYVCQRKLYALGGAPGPADPADADADPGVDARGDMRWRPDAHPDRDRADFLRIAEWARHTPTGDRAELAGVPDDAPIWAALTNTPDTRVGARCPLYEPCFVTQARRRAEQADLVLVNHHLFFADLALRDAHPGARVLPDYDAVIFDEAHQLEDVITEHFSVRVSTLRLAQLVKDAHHALTGGGALFATRTARSGLATGDRVIGHVESCAAGLFAAVARHLSATRTPGAADGRIALTPELFADGDRQEAWFRLDTALDELAAHARLTGEDRRRAGDDDRAEELAAVSARAAAIRDDLAAIAEQSADRYVYWGEHTASITGLCAAPVDIAPVVRRALADRVPAAVLTSATLTTGGSFAYFRRRMGLDPELADELAVPSPFDYASQALLYLPRDLPDPRDPGFVPAACARVQALVAITGGGAFVLFTSHRALRAAADRLRGALPHPVLVQGQEPRGVLLDRFRDRPGSVLLATGAFWEGVDVPGDALSLVVMDKLPFAPHTDPLVAARMRLAETRGADPFADYQVPRAALALKQGFGRLIRRGDDRGVVAVLDGRILGRAYGRAFLASLPAGVPRTSAIEQVRRWWVARVPGDQGGDGGDGGPRAPGADT